MDHVTLHAKLRAYADLVLEARVLPSGDGVRIVFSDDGGATQVCVDERGRTLETIFNGNPPARVRERLAELRAMRSDQPCE